MVRSLLYLGALALWLIQTMSTRDILVGDGPFPGFPTGKRGLSFLDTPLEQS